jgi:hypothetical protein
MLKMAYNEKSLIHKVARSLPRAADAEKWRGGYINGRIFWLI